VERAVKNALKHLGIWTVPLLNMSQECSIHRFEISMQMPNHQIQMKKNIDFYFVPIATADK
jgi:hypothetical protein